ncbi:MAG: ECF transporter S component [Clostridia bacterium]|nr:ECF transporter S component [Clostridia bacterium]
MKENKNREKTYKIVLYGLLFAMILILGITPLASIHVGTIEITLVMIPVAVGAIVMGPWAGAILGGFFGLTSFMQCIGIGVTSAFGATLLSISPAYTMILCFVPRILMGFLVGLIYQLMSKAIKKNVINCAAASLLSALLNTVFFMTLLMLLFGKTEFIMGFRGEMKLLPFIVAFVGLNGLVEMIVATVIGTAVSAALVRYLKNPDHR